MEAELMAGMYNTLVKLTHSEGRTYFTPQEICAGPVAEGFCTEESVPVVLKFMCGAGLINQDSNSTEPKYSASKPNYNMAYIGEDYHFVPRDNT